MGVKLLSKLLKNECYDETKKIHLQKKDLTRENLVEFSILFIMIFYGKAIKNSLENISQITFSNSENEKLKTLLINQINSNRAEKEIENEAIKIIPNLV